MRHIVILLSICCVAYATPPQVTDVIAQQRVGTFLVDVSYDLWTEDEHPANVSVVFSPDGGTNWTLHPQTLSGQIGTQVTPGAARTFTWDAGTDSPGLNLEQVRVKLTACSLVPTTGLVAWYPFSGSATDGSGHGFNGTVVGPVLTTDRFGRPSSAYLFDNINDYIQIPYNSAFTLLNGFTLAAWVYPITDNEDHRSGPIIWKLAASGGNADNYYLSYGDCLGDCGGGSWGCSKFIVGAERASNGVDYWARSNCKSAGIWYFIVGRYDLDKLCIFVNGVKEQEVTIGNIIPYSGTCPLRIGNLQHAGGHGNAGVFNGKIDEVRVYNCALSDSDILSLYGLQ